MSTEQQEIDRQKSEQQNKEPQIRSASCFHCAFEPDPNCAYCHPPASAKRKPFVIKIEDEEDLAEKQRLERANTIIIDCLHYAVLDDEGTDANAATRYARKQGLQKKKDIEVVVSLFLIAWVVTILIFNGFKGGGSWIQFAIQGGCGALLFLFSITRGITEIRCDSVGIHFVSKAAKSNLRAYKIDWHDLKKVDYIASPPGRPLSEGRLEFCYKTYGFEQRVKIPLSKIGNSRQWQQLLTALGRWASLTEYNLDLNLFENQLSTKDQSYTSLWLDAMSCPPQRQRLEPLHAGTTLQAGKYVIVNLLGAGGQGRAYLATTTDGASVVLKEYILPVFVEPRVRKQALHELENEISTLRSIKSNNVVRFVDSFFEDHRAYLVMEHIDGPSLKSFVKNHGPLPETQVIAYAKKMCEILSTLHGMTPPLVHRDFTPDNLLVLADDTLKLIDFTVAKRSDESGSEACGKHHYMAPEQFRGKVMPASDIYALGCTIHFLLTGEDPAPITTSFPILVNDKISAELSDIVAKCTALEAKDRYLNAQGVAQALDSL